MKYQLLLFLSLFTSCIQATEEPHEILKSLIRTVIFKNQKAFIKMSLDRKSIEVLFNGHERVLATLKEGTFFCLKRESSTLHLYACIGKEKFGFATSIQTLFLSKEEDNKALYWWMLDEKCGPVTPYLE